MHRHAALVALVLLCASAAAASAPARYVRARPHARSMHADAPVAEHLFMASIPNSADPDIVKAGVVQHDWSELTYTQNMNVDVPDISFYMKYSAGDRTQYTYTPTVFTSGGGSLGVDLTDNGHGLLSADEETSIDLTFVCRGTGTVTVQVMIDTQEFEAVTVYFNKTCDTSRKIPTHFNMGTEPNGVANLISGGKPTFLDRLLLVPYHTQVSHFYVWVSNTTLLPQLFDVVDVFPDLLQADPVAMCVKDCIARKYESTKKSNVTHVSIQYNCQKHLKDGVPKRASMTLSLALGGMYEPVFLTWQKDCAPPSPAPHHHHHGGSGWTPFGIFCFVVFWIVLLGCIFGCFFKYFKQEKRGVDVVPFSEEFKNCYHSVCVPKPKYTPQENYDAPLRSSGYGSTDYQTDL